MTIRPPFCVQRQQHIIKHALQWLHLAAQQSCVRQATLRGSRIDSNIIQMIPVHSQHTNVETLKKKTQKKKKNHSTSLIAKLENKARNKAQTLPAVRNSGALCGFQFDIDAFTITAHKKCLGVLGHYTYIYFFLFFCAPFNHV